MSRPATRPLPGNSGTPLLSRSTNVSSHSKTATPSSSSSSAHLLESKLEALLGPHLEKLDRAASSLTDAVSAANSVQETLAVSEKLDATQTELATTTKELMEQRALREHLSEELEKERTNMLKAAELAQEALKQSQQEMAVMNQNCDHKINSLQDELLGVVQERDECRQRIVELTTMLDASVSAMKLKEEEVAEVAEEKARKSLMLRETKSKLEEEIEHIRKQYTEEKASVAQQLTERLNETNRQLTDSNTERETLCLRVQELEASLTEANREKSSLQHAADQAWIQLRENETAKSNTTTATAATKATPKRKGQAGKKRARSEQAEESVPPPPPVAAEPEHHAPSSPQGSDTSNGQKSRCVVSLEEARRAARQRAAVSFVESEPARKSFLAMAESLTELEQMSKVLKSKTKK